MYSWSGVVCGVIGRLMYCWSGKLSMYSWSGKLFCLCTVGAVSCLCTVGAISCLMYCWSKLSVHSWRY